MDAPCYLNQILYYEKKEIKGIKNRLIVSVKKVLSANDKSLVKTLEKDLKRSLKIISVKKTKKGATRKKPV